MKRQKRYIYFFERPPAVRLVEHWPRFRCPLCGWLDVNLTADCTSLQCVACMTVMPAAMLVEAA